MAVTLPAWTPWRTRMPGGEWLNAPYSRTTPLTAEAIDNIETGILGARQTLQSLVSLQADDSSETADIKANYTKHSRFASSTGVTTGSREGTDPLIAVKYGTTAGTAAQGNDARFGIDTRLPSSAVTGDMLTWNGSAWVRIAKGSDGQLLASQSSSSMPKWVANPGGMPATTTLGALTYYNGTEWVTTNSPDEGNALRWDLLRKTMKWDYSGVAQTTTLPWSNTPWFGLGNTSFFSYTLNRTYISSVSDASTGHLKNTGLGNNGKGDWIAAGTVHTLFTLPVGFRCPANTVLATFTFYGYGEDKQLYGAEPKNVQLKVNASNQAQLIFPTTDVLVYYSKVVFWYSVVADSAGKYQIPTISTYTAIS